MSAAPELVWLNRQRAVSARQLRLPVVAEAAQRAWPDVAAAKRRGSVLRRLPEISFVLVSDARLAALHDEFLGDPAPTDVITFHHGEIVISAETARASRRDAICCWLSNPRRRPGCWTACARPPPRIRRSGR